MVKTLTDETIICVACGGHEHVRLFHLRAEQWMLRCQRCRLIFVLPQWTDEIARDVFTNWDGWPGGISVPDTTTRDIASEYIVRFIAQQCPAVGSILDVGCADGGFLGFAEHYLPAWEIHGAEPDEKWLGHDYGQAQVCHQRLRDCAYADDSFDVVTILDALCYFPDPDREFAEIARILKPGGSFVMDTPLNNLYMRLRGWIGGMMGLERTQTFASYPFYYSHQSLLYLAKQVGLKLTRRVAMQGVRYNSPAVNRLVPLAMTSINAAAQLLPQAFTLAPKVLYAFQLNDVS